MRPVRVSARTGLPIRRTLTADQYVAELSALVAIRGGTLIDTDWVDSNTRYAAVCSAGHACTVNIHHLRNGQSMCNNCSRGIDRAWQRLLDRVAELGGTVLDTEWTGRRRTYRVMCNQGHVNDVHPGNLWGKYRTKVCTECPEPRSVNAATLFRSAVESQGGTVLATEWLGNQTPHWIKCAEGHEHCVIPNNVREGHNICAHCARKYARRGEWDAFYVVVNDSIGAIKFGITYGDGTQRLNDHKSRYGYSRVVRLIQAMPDNGALTLENAVIELLRFRGYRPIQGREFFDIGALDLVVGMVDTLYPSHGTES